MPPNWNEVSSWFLLPYLSNIKFVNEYLTCLFRSVFKKFFHDFVEAALSCIVQGGVLEVV